MQTNPRPSVESQAAGPGRTSHRRQSKHVHYLEQDHRGRRNTNAGLDKEAIQIPSPPPRHIGRTEKFLATVMTGDMQASHSRGLTGKPLLYATNSYAACYKFVITSYRYFTSVFVSLGVFLFGYDQGVMSGIIT